MNIPTLDDDFVSVGEMMNYEEGNYDEESLIDMFQRLVNSGMAWQLQGFYGRQAKALLDAGLVTMPEKKVLTDSTKSV